MDIPTSIAYPIVFSVIGLEFLSLVFLIAYIIYDWKKYG